MENKLTVGAFLAVLAACIVFLLMPADTDSVTEENRTMTTIPPFTAENIFSGRLAQDTESAVGDNIGMRSYLKDLADKIQSLGGFVPETGEIIYTDTDIGTGTTQKQTLLLADNAAMEVFIRSREQEEAYAEAVNHYARKLPEGIRLYSMLIPTRLSFMKPMYRNLQDSQRDTIESIYEKLDENVTAVDAYSYLEAHSDEYIYFRTDHHWTQLGAYYGYRAFMDAEGGEAVSKDSYEVNTISGVLGYLYDRAPRSSLAENPDAIEWYDINADSHISVIMRNNDEELTSYNGVMYDVRKANYNFFMGSDHPVVEMINENNPNGKTLVILRESYANVFAPWIIESYGRVILIDPRIYTRGFDKILERYNPDEALILNYIFTANFEDYCTLLKNLYE